MSEPGTEHMEIKIEWLDKPKVPHMVLQAIFKIGKIAMVFCDFIKTLLHYGFLMKFST